MNTIKIKKGHDIRIAGIPSLAVENAPSPKTVGVRPSEFKYLKPKLMVKEGDTIKIGSPLFFDKKNPDIKWASPAAGQIKSIIYGERRSVLQVVIDRADSEETVQFDTFDTDQVSVLGREKVIEQILKANLWPLIRQRPFSKVADPKTTPKSIFVSGFNSGPLTVDVELALNGREKEFQTGLNLLSQLSGGKVYLNISAGASMKALTDAKNVELTRFEGPHPSGNVGIQIHHLDPINPDEVVWTIQAQHVATLGELFLTGKFNPELIVTVGGPAVTNPCHLKTRIGTSFESLVKDRVSSGKIRVVGGDPLSGRTAGLNDHIGYYTSTVSVLPVSEERPFLGWLAPGSSKRIYSLLRAYFFQSFKNPFHFNTNQNGSHRHMVPVNAWESVLPMDILPNPLYRSILAEDIEEMEKLGILECDEEDFALCTFACPSKINLGSAIRKGLDLVEKEG